MVLHFEMPGCMYVCVRESVFVCSSVHVCVYVCVYMVLYCVCIYRIVLMLRPVFMQVCVCMCVLCVCLSLSLSLSLCACMCVYVHARSQVRVCVCATHTRILPARAGGSYQRTGTSCAAAYPMTQSILRMTHGAR